MIDDDRSIWFGDLADLAMTLISIAYQVTKSLVLLLWRVVWSYARGIASGLVYPGCKQDKSDYFSKD